MPIYEYVCSGCGCQFEQLRPFSKSGEASVCPGCQKPAKRKVSAFAAFSRGADGGSAAPISGAGGGCSSCSSSSCSTCGG